MIEAGHRPWPPPSRPWALSQRWHDLLFMHWPVEPRALAALVPAPLELQTFDGRAWLGIVPFRMSDVRLRGLPALPWLSAFPELNVRTYTSLDDKPGVYFFSLDASNPLAVWAARFFFHLPYFRARMAIAGGAAYDYRSRRVHRGAPPAVFEASYAPNGMTATPMTATLGNAIVRRTPTGVPTLSAVCAVIRMGEIPSGDEPLIS